VKTSGRRYESDDVNRFRAVYAGRERRLASERDADGVRHGNAYLMRECRDRLARLLRERFERPVPECRILDVECGH